MRERERREKKKKEEKRREEKRREEKRREEKRREGKRREEEQNTPCQRRTLVNGIIAQSSVAFTPEASPHCSVKMFHMQQPSLLQLFSLFTPEAEQRVCAVAVPCFHAMLLVTSTSFSP